MSQGSRFPASLTLTLVMVATLASPAIAQPSSEQDTNEPPPSPSQASGSAASEPDTRPWASGVPAEDQRRAQELFAEGNEYLDNLGFATAAAKYRQAIERWPHPAIQYNLAIALIKLDQPIEAYRTITQALRHGAAPLDAEQYKQAQNYQQLLRRQIGEVELSCAQVGVEVKLDGKLVLTGPGTGRALVLVGEHQLVATRRGLRTVTRSLPVYSSATVKVRLVLFTEDELTGLGEFEPFLGVGRERAELLELVDEQGDLAAPFARPIAQARPEESRFVAEPARQVAVMDARSSAARASVALGMRLSACFGRQPSMTSASAGGMATLASWALGMGCSSTPVSSSCSQDSGESGCLPTSS